MLKQEHNLKVYGTPWCGDCTRSKAFLDKYRIPYEWLDVTKSHINLAYVLKVNHGRRVVPTILFPDGSILVEPTNEELGEKLGV